MKRPKTPHTLDLLSDHVLKLHGMGPWIKLDFNDCKLILKEEIDKGIAFVILDVVNKLNLPIDECICAFSIVELFSFWQVAIDQHKGVFVLFHFVFRVILYTLHNHGFHCHDLEHLLLPFAYVFLEREVLILQEFVFVFKFKFCLGSKRN